MKYILIFFLSQISLAHEGHHHGHGSDMKAGEPLSGGSIFQLDSKWKNQKGEDVKLTDLRGQSRLAVMIFTQCETACPLIIEDLKEIARDVQTKKSGPIEVSIFSLDSYRETPDTLKSFAVKRKLPAHWDLFHVTESGAVAELAAALGVRYKRLENGDFIHSNVIYYLNPEGEIVAQKEGLKTPRSEFVGKIKKSRARE